LGGGRKGILKMRMKRKEVGVSIVVEVMEGLYRLK